MSVYSDWKYAYEIENGRPSRDLKRMHLTMKVRVSTSKKNAGKRYLTIPFRHSCRRCPGRLRSAARLLTKSGSDRHGQAAVWERGLGHQDEGASCWWPSESTNGAKAARRAWRSSRLFTTRPTDTPAWCRMNTGAGKAGSSALPDLPHHDGRLRRLDHKARARCPPTFPACGHRANGAPDHPNGGAIARRSV